MRSPCSRFCFSARCAKCARQKSRSEMRNAEQRARADVTLFLCIFIRKNFSTNSEISEFMRRKESLVYVRTLLANVKNIKDEKKFVQTRVNSFLHAFVTATYFLHFVFSKNNYSHPSIHLVMPSTLNTIN